MSLWNLRFPFIHKFCKLPSPSNYHTFIRLRVNEWMLQIFHLPSPSYFQRAEILTKSMGILIISTCSITQMNCMFWQTQTVRFIKTYSSLWRLLACNLITTALLLLHYAPVVLKLPACSQANAGGQQDECPPVIGKKDLVNVLIFVYPSFIHT
jgi:hypothetical protein